MIVLHQLTIQKIIKKKYLHSDNEDIYNPSKLNETLRNIINNHQNISPENLLQIENEGNSNCLYLAISYHCYNNFKHHKTIRKNIAKALQRRDEELPNITINDNMAIIYLLKNMQNQYIN